MQHSISRARYHRGFTLLEIMVVVVIIGILATAVLLSVSVMGRDREMQDQAERLGAVLKQAQEECELEGFDVGMRVTDIGYDFLRFDALQQTWQPIDDDEFFRPRQLPEGLRFRLWLEGREVVLKPNSTSTDSPRATSKPKVVATKSPIDATGKTAAATADTLTDTLEKNDTPPPQPPQIMLLSSGDLNSFKLQLDREGTDTQWQVFSKPDNTVNVEQVDEKAFNEKP